MYSIYFILTSLTSTFSQSAKWLADSGISHIAGTGDILGISHDIHTHFMIRSHKAHLILEIFFTLFREILCFLVKLNNVKDMFDCIILTVDSSLTLDS